MPPDGGDLNPVLQDPGMTFHPPCSTWATSASRWRSRSRSPRCSAASWSRRGCAGRGRGRISHGAFLTCGIVAGSWWAYAELGWGGWWFWDPVENASFMPWLVGVALIHAQAVTEKRGSLRAWTILLSIFAFSLSLLGTFLVRSGVLTSVHAFASDPRRGLFILCFLDFCGRRFAAAVCAARAESGRRQGLCVVSRESAILVGNLMFTVAAAMVLLGTLVPADRRCAESGQDLGRTALLRFAVPAADVAGRAAAAVRPVPALGQRRASGIEAGDAARRHCRCGLRDRRGVFRPRPTQGDCRRGSAVWVAVGVLLYIVKRWREMPRGRRYPAEMAGMLLAHAGVAIFVIGVLLSESLSVPAMYAWHRATQADWRL
jgi:cytochrome c-type biogenesis protein CcmF